MCTRLLLISIKLNRVTFVLIVLLIFRLSAELSADYLGGGS